MDNCIRLLLDILQHPQGQKARRRHRGAVAVFQVSLGDLHFKNKEPALSEDPDRTDWVDIYAQEIMNDSYLSVRTVYVERHPSLPGVPGAGIGVPRGTTSEPTFWSRAPSNTDEPGRRLRVVKEG